MGAKSKLMEQLIGTLLRAKVWYTQDGIELYNGDQANTLPYRLIAYKLGPPKGSQHFPDSICSSSSHTLLLR